MKRFLPLVLYAFSLPLYANDLNYNIINFSESASITVANDTMSIQLTISHQGNNRQTVSNIVTNRFNAIQSKLKANSSFEAEILGRNVYPRYNDKQQIIAWQDSIQLRIKSKDFDALSKLMAEVQEQAQISHLSFSVSPQLRAKALEEASEKALAAFSKRAISISQNLGFSGRYRLVNLDINHSFEEHSNHGNTSLMLRSTTAKVSAPNMDIDNTSSGSRQVRQNVSGSIQLY